MKMKMENTFWVLVILGISCLALSGCQGAEAEQTKNTPEVRPVKAIQITSPITEHVLFFPATAKATREVELSFRVNGTLVYLNVEQGQKVNEGELIASLDARDYSIRIKRLEASLAASQAKLSESFLQYKRYENLFVNNSVAKSQYDSAKASYLTSQAQVEVDEKSLEDARNALADTQLEAPFTGFVHQKYVENHEAVSAGSPITSLVDLSTIEIEFGLPENLVDKISKFQKYTITFDAIAGREFTAVFKEAAKKPDPVTHAYPLTLILEKDTGVVVRPGMSATVRIDVSSQTGPDKYIVPLEALFNRGGETSLVWVYDEDEAAVRSLSVLADRITPQGVEISSGELKNGQWIVTAGVHHLQEGQKVRMIQKPSETNIGGML